MSNKIKALEVEQMVFDPKDDIVYVDFKHQRIILKCPNKNCGQTVVLPLKKGKQIWSVETKRVFWKKHVKDPITIHPSIYSTTHKEKCHYFIRKGKVVWCKDWE